MVQIKAVLRNFLPKKYEIAFNRRTTPDSFKSAVKFNATIAIFLLVIQFLGAPNILSQKDSSWWEYLYIIEGIIFGSVIFDGFFGYCFVTKILLVCNDLRLSQSLPLVALLVQQW